MNRYYLPATLAALSMCAIASPASALSTKDCSVKYQAAKQAGTLNGQKWNDFRKAECGADAASAPSSAPNPMAPTPTKTAAPSPAPAQTTAAARPSPTPTRSASTSTAAFPSAVDPKYAKESAGKARMHTCLDSYNAAKASGTLGDAKWIMKGGGYYSQCNSKLKS